MKTTNTTSMMTSRRIPQINLGTVWLLVWLCLAAWLGFGREWLTHNPALAQAALTSSPIAPRQESRTVQAQPKLEAVAISKMKVGDQIPADNPTGEKDTEFGNTVDPTSWRKLVLLAPKKDGSFADVELLRPLWWLEEQAAEVGGTVDIHVPECGIEGRAEVLAIQSCPPIKHDSRFRIVTGTFKHQASKVLDVYVEGLDEPIGTTPNHPFWSEDRQTFVRADELKEGEHLRAFNGTPLVRRVVPLADPEPVFNLEVQCEHVYHVAKNGILVHNSGTLCPDAIASLVNSGHVAIIGRYMSRVTAARGIFDDATEAMIHTYNWRKYRGLADLTEEQLDDAVRLNREWLQRQIDSGSQIFDIGTSDATLGAFYSEELLMVGDRLTPVLRGQIDIGGELVDLWEWVRPVVAP